MHRLVKHSSKKRHLHFADDKEIIQGRIMNRQCTGQTGLAHTQLFGIAQLDRTSFGMHVVTLVMFQVLADTVRIGYSRYGSRWWCMAGNSTVVVHVARWKKFFHHGTKTYLLTGNYKKITETPCCRQTNASLVCFWAVQGRIHRAPSYHCPEILVIC